MQLKKKDQEHDQTLLTNHLEIQEHHQKLLENLLQKPSLQQPELINPAKQGLSTPNQQYAQQLQAIIKEKNNNIKKE